MSGKHAYKLFNSSVAKKVFMAISGLMLCGFLVSHLIGNFLMVISDQAFNKYAHALISNPLIYGAEAALLLIFLIHMGMGIKLSYENYRARPTRYYLKTPSGRGGTIASRSMPYTGSIILIFLVTHIIQFKYGTHYDVTYDGSTVRDLHKLVVLYFANPLNLAWYIIAMLSVGMHVSHGFWSAFQTLGFNHSRYTPVIQVISIIYAVVITLCFSGLPVWAYLQGVN